jgi:predicted transcriptional regulator
MDKKQKKALIIALAEKGETYRDITKKAGVSPNTIKAVLNRAGLDESTSIHSRTFELFSEGKTPLQVAITLNLEAETAIQYHQQYYMLLGCTEFTRVYLQIKENPWPYVKLVQLVHNSGMSDDEVEEILKLAKGHLQRVKLEYDRLKAELNSWKAEISNTVRTYQQFVDRNIELKNREDELLKTIGELEAKKTELQKSLSQSELQDNDTDNTNMILKTRLEEIISTSDVSIQRSNVSNNNHQNENNEVHIYYPQVGPSSRKSIFDTKDLF